MHTGRHDLFMKHVFKAVYVLLWNTFWFWEQMFAVVTYWWSFKIWSPDYHWAFLVKYIHQIMPHHTESMLPNIRGYLRSSIKWSQSATSDGMLLMLTRHFQHWWHWWQCLSLSASDMSHGKSQEWVRQIRLTHYILSWDQWQTIHWVTCINQRLILWIYGSFTPDFVTDICLNGPILCEPVCLQSV